MNLIIGWIFGATLVTNFNRVSGQSCPTFDQVAMDLGQAMQIANNGGRNYHPKDVNNQRTGKIIGGSPVNPGDVPFMAAIVAYDSTQSNPINRFGVSCGGTLVRTSVVLTAAHCLYDRGLHESENWPNVLVKLGSVFKNPSPQETVDLYFRTSRIVVHPQYDQGSSKNDVALIFLCNSTDGIVNVKPAQLTANTAPGIYPVPNLTDVFVAGWGMTISDDINTFSKVLMQTRVQLQDFNGCNNNIYGGALDITIQVCAGLEGGNSDICQADNGGGLYTSTQLLIGVASFSEFSSCGNPLIPSIYSYAPAFTDWINQTSDPGRNVTLS